MNETIDIYEYMKIKDDQVLNERVRHSELCAYQSRKCVGAILCSGAGSILFGGVGVGKYLVLKGIVCVGNPFLFICAERQPPLEQLHL